MPGDAPAPQAAGHPPRDDDDWRYWTRPIVLAVVVVILLIMTWWDTRRIPTRPARPAVLTATPAAGASITVADVALAATLRQLAEALERGDAQALARLADPEGVVIASYGGGMPDTGYGVDDAQRFAREILSGSRVSILGWRSDGRGRIIVLSDGWPNRTLRLAPIGTIELTSLAAIGLQPRGETWYWRWLLPDSSGTLAQHARSITWQAMPR